MKIPVNIPVKPPTRGPPKIPATSPAKLAAKDRRKSAFEPSDSPREGPGTLRVKGRARYPGKRGARADVHPMVFEAFERRKPKSRALEKLKAGKKRRTFV
ncbi:MAG: hypothetical protein JNM60_11325 [Candidatus Competibacteraceae bacterium]|nr:hypothetical protein [Candidatus Competibacteraceae bacterium]